jgi:pimeloyl-ACP methyl ester carboxylesterase
MKRGVASGPAGALSYTVWEAPAGSEREPLLCLHPINTGAEIWADVGALLCEERTVVALDYRGHGDSVMSGPFGAPHYAADALAVLDHLGIARAHLAAGSIGGAVAVETLAAAPGRVLSVAAFGATLRIGLGDDDLQGMAKSLREMGVRRWFDEHGHLILGPKAQANAAAELTRIAVASGRTVSIVTEVLWETFGKADARPTVSRLANPRPPALVAVGSHDPTCPLAMAKDLDILGELRASDPNPEVRQVLLVGAAGDAAAWTGENCIGFAASLSEGPVAVAGNMLANADVIPAMLAAYRSSPAGKGANGLGARILSAMRAAEDTGGDVRGSQGGVLVVVDGEPTAEPWAHKPIDLRVDDASEPIGELERLLKLRQAFDPVYATMFAPGLMVGPFHEPAPGDLARAAAALADASAVIGDNQEARFWHAILLARSGAWTEARTLFAAATKVVPALSQLADKLVSARILSQAQREAL